MAARICVLLLLLALSCAAWGDAVEDVPSVKVMGRRLRIMDFRLDGLGSTLDFLPSWASTKVKEWFPVLGGNGPSGEVGGVEVKPRSKKLPSVHFSGDDLVVSGPNGDLNLVIVPEKEEGEGRTEEVANCTNEPPLGATCQQVVDFDSCSLPVIAGNNICDEMCGRCQSSPLPKDSDSSKDKESDKKKGGEEDGDAKEGEGDKSVGTPPQEKESTDKGGSDCQSLAEFLSSRSDLGVSSKLFQNAQYPLLRAVLEDSFVGTVFVPNDAAFDELASQLGISKDLIINASQNFWDQVIDAHIVPGLPRRKFQEGQEFPTLSARWDIFVKKGESGELQLESQAGFRASIVEQDITACSSVIHIVNNIILPVQKEEAIRSFKSPAEHTNAGR